jgi:lipid II:glycine glycyltransferase (peptidoglycan interpeptide bridge formation enzyme)
MIKSISDSVAWNDFVYSCSPYTFLQSWEWGQVQKTTGDDVQYLGFFEEGQQVGAAIVITVNAKRGRHFLIPHGPIAKTEVAAMDLVPELLEYLKENNKSKACAIRIAPLLISSKQSLARFKSLGMRPAPLHVHAELTWILDISESEETLLSEMRKTTRHAIGKAERSDISIEIVEPAKALDRFWELYKETKDRHKFTPWPYDMLKAQIDIFDASDKVFAVVATHEGKDVSAAILIHFGSTVYYYHGASKRLPSSLPANQLVQWTAIKEAKRRGATSYNFWGIAPEDKPEHPFAGITTFKKGFGGKAYDYMHAHDLSLSLRYYPLLVIESWRRYKRGF